MIGNIGLIAGLALLIFLALRGTNILFSSLLASLVIVVTNQLPLAASFTEYYPFGPLGAFTFAGKFFLLFACGAMFGNVIGKSHAASSIAIALANKLGPHRVLWIVTLSCALLTYGGVVVFVVIFSIYPLGLKLAEQANIPKRLLVAAMALGAGTFTLSAMPGTPSIQNVIPTVVLGTDLFAGAFLGIFGGMIMFVLGIWYLERQRISSHASGEVFIPSPSDQLLPADGDPLIEHNDYPDWKLALLPILIVLSAILAPRIIKGIASEAVTTADSAFYQLVNFASSQVILWPSIALFFGSIIALILFPAVRYQPLKVMGDGVMNSILPLISTAVVIGFGGVVVHTAGFGQFSNFVLNLDMPPLLSMFAAVNLNSALVGSASGGLQIFMQTMAPDYLAMGISPGVLHRLAAMSSGGFDSLPHCGAIIALLTVTGMTHKQAYKDIGIITVVIPVIATLSTIAVVSII
ncbi:MAG: GntP family permease [Proteobacteria bacterium]|nr:GntP family permease [Pseudomonadota bacterium]